MKFLIGIGLLVSCSMVFSETLQIPDEGKSLKFTGIVTKLITTPDGSFKAHYLKLAKPISFNDDNACGEITQDKIALNEFNLQKFVNKKVSVTGTVFCQQQYTGDYHLQDIKIKVL